MKPQNLPEKLIWFYILGTYPIYYIGGLYLFAPLLAAYLFFYLIKQWWNQTDETPNDERIELSAPAWVWLGCMSIVAFAAVIGGIDFDLPLSKIIFTLVNRWFRTWALMAIFPVIGHLNIRPQLIYRAVCIFCIQSLILVPIFTACYYLFNAYDYGFVSPLSKFGGGVIFYVVKVFGSTLDVTEKRLQMIAPWPPALGLVGDLFFCLCLQETNKKLKVLGMAGAAALTFGSISRMAIFCLIVIIPTIWVLSNVTKPWLQITLSGTLFGSAIFYSSLKEKIDSIILSVRQFRSGSTRAREAIQQLAMTAWRQDAPIWGHGTFSENGPASVGFRGIGSHHTWLGLLYAHGIVGALPLAIAFAWSFFDLLTKLGTHKHAVVGLSILIILIIFSFEDNIDGLAYLYWPSLIVLGIAFKENVHLKPNSSKMIYT